MEARGFSHDYSTYMLSLGVKEDQEEQQGEKAWMSFQADEGRKEKNAQGKPGLGVEGGEKEREKELKRVESHFGPGASGPMDGENKDVGTSGDGLEQEHQQEGASAGSSGVQETLEPMEEELPYHHNFSQWQLEQLETIFQRSHSGNTPARKDLARWMGVTETRVRDWFKIRRATYRRNRRKAKLRGTLSGTHATSP